MLTLILIDPKNASLEWMLMGLLGMSFLDLVGSDDALGEIASNVAHRALNIEFAPVTNSGVTPDRLLQRIRSSTIPRVAEEADISGDLTHSLVQAVDDLGL
ncbi:hypothetical protein ACCD06_25815 [Azospirillum sp. CT11-132]|jgi:hypothetical protein|uniref:hypothetical protein n=1 Tax=unclassified Azospirillum TaxID=2630922 RepID=UPI0011B1FCED|nr:MULTISPECIES: hypothetical protein [unclassified Azospirillum]